MPVWWPAYLERIRDRSHASSPSLSTKNTTFTASPITPRQASSHANNRFVRTLTNTSLHAQGATALAAPEGKIETALYEGSNGSEHLIDTIRAARFVRTKHEQGKGSKKQLKGAVTTLSDNDPDRRDNDVKLDETWKKFTEANDKKAQASSTLHFLAMGQERQDLERALRAFEHIPKTQRQAEDYDTAVDVSSRLGQYSTAIPLIKEAISRNLGHESFFKFLALCISRSLWTTAAEIWTDTKQMGLLSDNKDTRSKKRNFAGRYITHLDAVPDLLSKMNVLTKRLLRDDPVLVAYKDELNDLCKHLLLVVAESTRLMAFITSNGALSLFEMSKQLRLNSNLHFATIATLGQLSEKGSRNELAMIIYRNFKFARPDAFIPKWVFATMLGICSSAKSNPSIYQLLLEDYRQKYGTIDTNLYVQVMRACASQGEVDSLCSMFDDFCKDRRPRHADDLNPLIRVHAVVGDCQQAQLQFDRIQTEFGLVPSVRNWNALILAYGRSGKPEQAHEKFKEMKQNNVKPDEYSWSMLVALSSNNGDTKSAHTLIKQAKLAGITPPLAMIGALIDSHLLNDHVNEAEYLVVESTRAAMTSVESSESPVRLWNSLFRYYAFKSDSEAILRTQEKMKVLNVKADSMTYAALMTALVVQRRTKDATQILRTLHFSQALTVSEFHYSIIIHGLAMEKERDLAQVVYSEMLERFPRATPSVKLAMLYLQATKDEETARSNYLAGKGNLRPDFTRTLDAIRDVLANSRMSDLASSTPNPGFGRKTALGNLEQLFLGSLIRFLHRNNAHSESHGILEMLEKSQGLTTRGLSGASQSWTSQLDTLSRRIDIAIEVRDWAALPILWQQIIDGAVQNCVSIDNKRGLSAQRTQTTADVHNIQFVGHGGSQFPSMIPQSSTATAPSTNMVQVLPAHRYILSRPMSQYIKALDMQQNHEEIIKTIKTLRGHGFHLSSKNWNSLIQALCRSSDQNHNALAYELFDTHLLPNAPPWNAIRRGKWIQPSEERLIGAQNTDARMNGKRQSRKALEKFKPDLLMPTYYTMIYLAVVWLNATRSASQGDHSIRHRLQRQTARTVRLVLKTPYLKDRLQGVLLRGRKVIGDFPKLPPTASGPVAFPGIQSSALLVDHLSPDTRAELDSVAASDYPELADDSLPIAERALGEIPRSAMIVPSEQRFETHHERRKRFAIARTQRIQEYQSLITQIRKRSQGVPALMGNMLEGQPAEISPSLIAEPDRSSNASSPQQLRLYEEISEILRGISRKPFHDTNDLSSTKQQQRIRTGAFDKRLAVQLSSPVDRPERLTSREPHSPSRWRKSRHEQTTDSLRKAQPILGPRSHLSIPKSLREHQSRLQERAKYLRSVYKTEKTRMATEVIVSRRRRARLQRLRVAAIRASDRASNAALRRRLRSLIKTGTA